MTKESNLLKIKNCGAFGYSYERTAEVCGDPTLVEKLNGDTEEAKAYRSGDIEAQYLLDVVVFEAARKGDIQMIDEFMRRKSDRNG